MCCFINHGSWSFKMYLLVLLVFTVHQITLVIWTVIRIGPNGCDSMEFHESGLLRFKQKADMGIVHPLHKSTVGGRKDQDLVLVGNNNPVRISEYIHSGH